MKTLEELQAIRDKMKSKIANRGIADDNNVRVTVGMATCGIAAGARETLKALTDEAEARKLDNVIISQTGCLGMCRYEPIVEVTMPGAEKVTYILVNAEKARAIVSSHIVNNNVVKEYTVDSVSKEEK